MTVNSGRHSRVDNWSPSPARPRSSSRCCRCPEHNERPVLVPTEKSVSAAVCPSSACFRDQPDSSPTTSPSTPPLTPTHVCSRPARTPAAHHSAKVLLTTRTTSWSAGSQQHRSAQTPVASGVWAGRGPAQRAGQTAGPTAGPAKPKLRPPALVEVAVLPQVLLDHGGDLARLELSPGDGLDERLGLVDAERQIATVEQTEHAGG